MADEVQTDVESVGKLFVEGEEFASQVNIILHEYFDGDVTHPGWFEFCQQMDEWATAVASG